MAKDETGDRDDEEAIYQMTEEEYRLFEHDMDVYVEMLATGSTEFDATVRRVDARRREDRRLMRQWQD